MVDHNRILSKIDQLDGYLKELDSITLSSLEEYAASIEKKRACERLLQISVECVIDICHLLVSGLKLGLPSEENDLFDKLEQSGILSSKTVETLRNMKGFRNIIVHEYGSIDNAIVYEIASTKVENFKEVRKAILSALKALKQ